MSKRLQVAIDEAEVDAMKRLARAQGMTLAEWVRQTLRRACECQPAGDIDRKLAQIRASLVHCFPAPPVEQMLDEISRGYDSMRDR